MLTFKNLRGVKLTIPRLSHKIVGQLSKFENVPNFTEGRAAYLGQNFA